MKRHHQINTLFLSKSTLLLLVLTFSSLILTAQPTYKFYKNKSAKELLANISNDFGVQFNYLDKVLPEGSYSFSFRGNESDLIATLAGVLDREIISLSPNTYALTSKVAVTKAPPTKVSGHIFDSEGALIGSIVSIEVCNLATQTDATGYFELRGYFTEQDVLKVQYLGYNTKYAKVSDCGEKIQLEPSSHELGTIVITDYMKSPDNTSSIQVLDMQNRTIAGSADKDVLMMSQCIPGVYNSSESLNDLQIRGGSPDQVTYKWNGIPLFQNSLFYGRVSPINPFLCSDILISKNGSPVSSAHNIAGTIEGTYTHRDTSLISGRLHTNLLYSNAGLGWNLWGGRWNSMIAYRASTNKILNSSIFSKYYDNVFQFGKIQDDQYYIDRFDLSSFVNTNSTFSFKELSFAQEISLSKTLLFNIDGITYGNSLGYRWSNDFEPSDYIDSLQIRTQGLHSGIQYQLAKKWVLKGDYAYSDYLKNDRFIPALQDSSDIFNSNRLSQSDFIVQVEYKLNSTTQLDGGISLNNWSNMYKDSTLFFDDTKDTYDNTSNEKAVFGKIRYRPNTRFDFDLAFRWARYSEAAFDRPFFDPRLHIRYYVKDNWYMYLHFANSHQNLIRRNVFSRLQADNGHWFVANERNKKPYLNVVESAQWSFGQFFSKGKFSSTIEGYRKIVKNVWTSSFDFYYAEDPYEFANLDITGLEVHLDWRGNRWTFNLNYDYVRDYIVADNADFKIRSPFSQPHRLQSSVTYAIRNSSFHIQSHIASGRYYSKGNKLQEVIEEDGDTFTSIDYQSILSNQVPAYINIDASFVQTIPYGHRGKRLQLGVHGTNILNRQNIIKNLYFIDYKEDPIELGIFSRRGLPFVFNLSVDATF